MARTDMKSLESDWRNDIEADQCCQGQRDCNRDQVNIGAALCGVWRCHPFLDSAGVEMQDCVGQNKTHAGFERCCVGSRYL